MSTANYITGTTSVNGIVHAPIVDVWKIFRPFDFNYGYNRWEIIDTGSGKEDIPGALRIVQRIQGSSIITERLVIRDDNIHMEQYAFVKSEPPIAGLGSVMTTVKMTTVEGKPKETLVNWSSEWTADPSVAPTVKKTQESAYSNIVNFLDHHFAGVNGKLNIKLIRGTDLTRTEAVLHSNPYVVLVFGQFDLAQTSNIAHQTQNPIWNQDFSFDIVEKSTKLLRVSVFDNNHAQKLNDIPIGTATYDLSTLDVMKRIDLQLKLENVKAGTIDLQIHINTFFADWQIQDEASKYKEAETKMVMELLTTAQEAVAQLVNDINASEVDSYKYARYPDDLKDLPRMVAGLPCSKALSPEKIGQLQQRIIEYLYSNTDLYTRLKQHDPRNWLDVFTKVYFNRWVKPPMTIIRDWQKDEEFCRQLLQGLNPMVIAKVTTTTPVSKELRRLTSNKKTVDQLISEGRLFILDYAVLEGFQQHLDMFLYAPMVLLENTDTGLKILGIQLTRDKDTENEVITQDTAKTHPNRYLFAKIHVACSDLQVHQFVYHLGFTHLAMDSFAIAHHNVWSKRFSNHKLGHLMEPHYKDTIGINYLARQTLVAHKLPFTDKTFSIGTIGGLHILQKAWRRWDFRGFSFPEELRARGFTEEKSDNVKNYYFREDGFKIWNAIKAYVAAVVNEQYKKDEDVAKDEAVQAWYDELKDPERADIQSFPELKTRKVLIESITTIIFNCSAQHSAINYSQLPYISFVPNRPDALYRPMPPKLSTDITEEYIGAALPKTLVSIFQVAFSYLLTTPPNRSDLMSELAATRDLFPAAHALLMSKMKQISIEIKARNDALEKEGKTPYPWLQPDMINMSIAI